MTGSTPCECSGPGFCERHGCRKTAHLFNKCLSDRRFFDAWEAGHFIGQPRSNDSASAICVYRGNRLRTEECEVGCKSLRGKEVPIYSCPVHGECSARRYKMGQPEQICTACDSYIPASRVNSAAASIDPIPDVSVAVTTCKRSTSYLSDCCFSLLKCGVKPIIVAEPGTDLRSVQMLDCRINESIKGPWHNWVNACRILLETDAETLVVVQDDTIFQPCAFQMMQSWIDKTNWNDGKAGLFGLYTSRKYHRKNGEFHRVNTKSLWGACALAFPRDVLASAIESGIAKNWNGANYKSRRGMGRQPKRPPEKVGNIDTAIGKIIVKLGLEMWFHSPSLSQHVGDVSAMNHGRATGNRIAKEVIRCP